MSEKYRYFTADDFASDDFFRKWVFEKKSDAERFWTQWVEKHPEKRRDVKEAIALLKTFEIQEAKLTGIEIDLAVQQTLNMIEKGSYSNEKRHPETFRRWTRYAAAIVLLSAIWWVGNNISGKKAVSIADRAHGADQWVSIDNTLTSVREEFLPDGSRVVLDPNATVRYSNASGNERTVFLSGSAFFDVVRKPDQPFKVVTDDLVTQVLGTSFKVISDLASRQTKVRVMTGKVEVSVRNKTKGRGNNTVLYPNQEIVYKESGNQMTKTVVADPVEVQKPERKDFVYEDAPIVKIFDELEMLYGVSITYDKDLLANCQITASFSNETFWEKLNLICRSVRATVEERDGEIFIKSEGCKY